MYKKCIFMLHSEAGNLLPHLQSLNFFVLVKHITNLSYKFENNTVLMSNYKTDYLT